MKTMMSALVALAALAAVGSPANAALSVRDSGPQKIERHAKSQFVHKAAWSEQDQKRFWEELEDRGGG